MNSFIPLVLRRFFPLRLEIKFQSYSMLLIHRWVMKWDQLMPEGLRNISYWLNFVSIYAIKKVEVDFTDLSANQY